MIITPTTKRLTERIMMDLVSTVTGTFGSLPFSRSFTSFESKNDILQLLVNNNQ